MKLIIINGPCGIGKSTVAKRLHDALALSFYLDGDAQSRYISHYKEHDIERREITRAVCAGIIEACFKVGHDVIVDKMMFDQSVLNAYYQIAQKYQADVSEFILWAPKDLIMSRAHARGFPVDNLLTPEKCERFWHEIDKLKGQRPLAQVIDVTNLGENDVFNKLIGIIEK